MAVNAQLLQRISQGASPVTLPDPLDRYKALAAARAGMQGEEINAINIQNARTAQTDRATAQTQAADEWQKVQQIFSKHAGDVEKAAEEILATPWRDPEIPKTYQGIATSRKTAKLNQDKQTLDESQFRETQLVNNAKARQDRLTLEATEAQRKTVADQNRINAETLAEERKRTAADREADNRRADARDAQIAADAKAGRENALTIAGMPARSSGVSPEDVDIDAYVGALARGELQPQNVPMKVRDKVLRAAQDQGVSIMSDKEREAMGSLDSALEVLEDIKKYSVKIHTSSGPTARVGGMIRQGASYAGWDADVTSLQSKAGELALIIRALGEKGTLAEGDVTRGLQMLPTNPRLTKEESENMLTDLSGLLTNVKKRRFESTTKTFGGNGPSEALINANMAANPGMTREQVIQELSK